VAVLAALVVVVVVMAHVRGTGAAWLGFGGWGRWRLLPWQPLPWLRACGEWPQTYCRPPAAARGGLSCAACWRCCVSRRRQRPALLGGLLPVGALPPPSPPCHRHHHSTHPRPHQHLGTGTAAQQICADLHQRKSRNNYYIGLHLGGRSMGGVCSGAARDCVALHVVDMRGGGRWM
jgi:hypothetical protein